MKYAVSLSAKLHALILADSGLGAIHKLPHVVLAWKYKDVTVEKGARIAQLMILPCETMKLIEVDHLGNPSRGKFGSTGTR